MLRLARYSQNCGMLLRKTKMAVGSLGTIILQRDRDWGGEKKSSNVSILWALDQLGLGATFGKRVLPIFVPPSEGPLSCSRIALLNFEVHNRTHVDRSKDNLFKWEYLDGSQYLCGTNQTIARMTSCSACPNNWTWELNTVRRS